MLQYKELLDQESFLDSQFYLKEEEFVISSPFVPLFVFGGRKKGVFSCVEAFKEQNEGYIKKNNIAYTRQKMEGENIKKCLIALIKKKVEEDIKTCNNLLERLRRIGFLNDTERLYSDEFYKDLDEKDVAKALIK